MATMFILVSHVFREIQ